MSQLALELGLQWVQEQRPELFVSRASRPCLAGLSNMVQAGWVVPAMQGTQLQTAAGWAKGRWAVGQSQKAGSCHTEHQNAEGEEEKGKAESQEGQRPEQKSEEEPGWTGWRTLTYISKHLAKAKISAGILKMNVETVEIILTHVEI